MASQDNHLIAGQANSFSTPAVQEPIPIITPSTHRVSRQHSSRSRRRYSSSDNAQRNSNSTERASNHNQTRRGRSLSSYGRNRGRNRARAQSESRGAPRHWNPQWRDGTSSNNGYCNYDSRYGNLYYNGRLDRYVNQNNNWLHNGFFTTQPHSMAPWYNQRNPRNLSRKHYRSSGLQSTNSVQNVQTRERLNAFRSDNHHNVQQLPFVTPRIHNQGAHVTSDRHAQNPAHAFVNDPSGKVTPNKEAMHHTRLPLPLQPETESSSKTSATHAQSSYEPNSDSTGLSSISPLISLPQSPLCNKNPPCRNAIHLDPDATLTNLQNLSITSQPSSNHSPSIQPHKQSPPISNSKIDKHLGRTTSSSLLNDTRPQVGYDSDLYWPMEKIASSSIVVNNPHNYDEDITYEQFRQDYLSTCAMETKLVDDGENDEILRMMELDDFRNQLQAEMSRAREMELPVRDDNVKARLNPNADTFYPMAFDCSNVTKNAIKSNNSLQESHPHEKSDHDDNDSSSDILSETLQENIMVYNGATAGEVNYSAPVKYSAPNYSQSTTQDIHSTEHLAHYQNTSPSLITNFNQTDIYGQQIAGQSPYIVNPTPVVHSPQVIWQQYSVMPVSTLSQPETVQIPYDTVHQQYDTTQNYNTLTPVYDNHQPELFSPNIPFSATNEPMGHEQYYFSPDTLSLNYGQFQSTLLPDTQIDVLNQTTRTPHPAFVSNYHQQSPQTLLYGSPAYMATEHLTQLQSNDNTKTVSAQIRNFSTAPAMNILDHNIDTRGSQQPGIDYNNNVTYANMLDNLLYSDPSTNQDALQTKDSTINQPTQKVKPSQTLPIHHQTSSNARQTIPNFSQTSTDAHQNPFNGQTRYESSQNNPDLKQIVSDSVQSFVSNARVPDNIGDEFKEISKIFVSLIRWMRKHDPNGRSIQEFLTQLLQENSLRNSIPDRARQEDRKHS